MNSVGTTESATSVAEWLRESSAPILLEWEHRIRQEVSSARFQDSGVLRNHIPHLLAHIADIVAKSQGHALDTDAEPINPDARLHGTERATLGQYLLEEVIREYHILRQVIFRAVEIRFVLSCSERDAILNVLEQAVNDTATEFMDAIRSFQETFLLGLVHDLRGPAHAATLALQRIIRDKDADIDGARKLANMALENLKRIDRMVTDLLDASKAQAGGSIAHMEFMEFELNSFVRGVLTDMGVHDVMFSTSSPEIFGIWSREGVRRIIENLVGNALKFRSPATPVRLALEDSRTSVKISIHNEGDVIPLADRAQLFETFARGSQHSARGGWGIGLVLVKGLVDAHHGTIEIESREGEGTTFIVRLPREHQPLL